MPDFPDQPFTDVYIIYIADVISESARDIDCMAPASHMPAGYRHDSPERAWRERIAALFTQTEGDEQYEYGYLGKEYNPPRIEYFPYGYADPEGLDEPAECAACQGMGSIQQGSQHWRDCPECGGRGTEPAGQGQHRTWAAELTRKEWLTFADAYLIDLDANGYPAEYEETMGSITEHGHLEAVSVDNSQGWGNGYSDPVLDSRMYVSFAYASDPDSGPS